MLHKELYQIIFSSIVVDSPCSSRMSPTMKDAGRIPHPFPAWSAEQAGKKRHQGDADRKPLRAFPVPHPGSILSIVLESYASLNVKYRPVFRVFEIVTVVVFSAEYILRIWTADLLYPVGTCTEWETIWVWCSGRSERYCWRINDPGSEKE